MTHGQIHTDRVIAWSQSWDMTVLFPLVEAGVRSGVTFYLPIYWVAPVK